MLEVPKEEYQYRSGSNYDEDDMSGNENDPNDG
jgi:hypothetical protein